MRYTLIGHVFVVVQFDGNDHGIVTLGAVADGRATCALDLPNISNTKTKTNNFFIN